MKFKKWTDNPKHLGRNSMFKAFDKKFKQTDRQCIPSNGDDAPFKFESEEVSEFIEMYGGATFNQGLYRVHHSQELRKWNDLVEAAFPQFASRLQCFAYDWMGTQFALDKARKDEAIILMLEPGTGKALKIPADFKTFHETTLIEEADAVLVMNAFSEWKLNQSRDLLHNECVGYRVPLFLGGSDTSENHELSDMEVYWSLCGQLLNKTKNLPDGTKVGNITIT